MPEYKVTFNDCVVRVRYILAEDEDKARKIAEDMVCKQAAQTSFDLWLTYGEVEREE